MPTLRLISRMAPDKEIKKLYNSNFKLIVKQQKEERLAYITYDLQHLGGNKTKYYQASRAIFAINHRTLPHIHVGFTK